MLPHLFASISSSAMLALMRMPRFCAIVRAAREAINPIETKTRRARVRAKPRVIVFFIRVLLYLDFQLPILNRYLDSGCYRPGANRTTSLNCWEKRPTQAFHTNLDVLQLIARGSGEPPQHVVAASMPACWRRGRTISRPITLVR